MRTVTAQKSGYETQTREFLGGYASKVDLVLPRSK